MKHLLKILIFSFALLNNFYAIAQWQWANHLHSKSYDDPTAICNDSANNIYLAGVFEGDTLFGNTNNAKGSIFLAKYDTYGNELWFKGFSGSVSRIQRINSLIYDPYSSCIYMTGNFYLQIIFGNDTLIGNGQSDFFITKIDLAGNFLWSKIAGGSHPFYDDLGYCVATDDSGNVYVTGQVVDSTLFESTLITSGGFLIKYDTDGNLIFGKSISGMSAVNGRADFYGRIKIISDKLYIYGGVGKDTISIDTITIYHKGVTICRFNLNGNIEWAKVIGCPASVGSLIEFDSFGNIFVAGFFYDSCYIDSVLMLSSGHTFEFFLCKLNLNGELVWLRNSNTSSSGGTRVFGLTVDDEDHIYLSGTFNGTTQFGNQSFSPAGTYWPGDAFIASYNSSGDFLGMAHFGPADGRHVTFVDQNKPVFTGIFYRNGPSDSINIGNNTFYCTDIVFTPPGQDIFIAKHDVITEITETRLSNDQLLIYANPMNGICTIKIPEAYYNERNLQLNILSIDGKVIQQIPVEANKEKIRINLEQQAKGIYPVILSNGQSSFRGKIVFE